MALPKEERYTYTDYLEQDGKERIELIDGAVSYTHLTLPTNSRV